MPQLLSHLDAAYNLARWLTRNEHDAEDIVQDAYLRTIRHFGGFHGGEGRAWLLTIVRNRCYDSARHKGVRERTTPFDEDLHNTRQVVPNNRFFTSLNSDVVTTYSGLAFR